MRNYYFYLKLVYQNMREAEDSNVFGCNCLILYFFNID